MPPLPEPEGEWEEGSDDDGVQERIVNRPWSKLALWSNQSPNGGRSKEDLIVWASQRAFLTLLTHVGDVGEHPLFDSNLNESGRARTNQLNYYQVSDGLKQTRRYFYL
jgi:hypothetical protein